MVKENTVTDLEAENKSPVEQSLDDFRDYLEFNNMSSNTIHVYLFAVKQFLGLYHVISHDNLMLYKCYLMEHYKPQTVNLRIRALNCYTESFQPGRLRILKKMSDPFRKHAVLFCHTFYGSHRRPGQRAGPDQGRARKTRIYGYLL